MLRRRRDHKVIPVLKSHAPVWLQSETFDVGENIVMFSVVFRDPSKGWVRRRYQYDATTDVLYFMGEVSLSDSEAMIIQHQAQPYIN